MLRKVGAIGDIHAEDQILERVLGHLESAGVDAGLPATRSFQTVRGPLLLCHGLGQNDMAGPRPWPWDDGYALESRTDLYRILREGAHRDVINGHTHQRMVRRIDGVTFVNAGTIHRAHEPCFVIVDFAAASVTFCDIGDEIRPTPTQALP